jgi:hypothetical protein
MKTSDERPALSCPECGKDGLIPADGRGRHDSDGNEIRHADSCRCRWCDWWWTDDMPHVTCSCGAVVGVDIEDNHAYAKLIAEAAPQQSDALDAWERDRD